jgi:hypothetical protein
MKEMLLRLSFNVLMAQRRKVGFRKYGWNTSSALYYLCDPTYLYEMRKHYVYHEILAMVKWNTVYK